MNGNLKYPTSFRGGPKRTLLVLSAIFKYCFCAIFCLPFLSMLFSSLFPTIQNLISSNYALNNLCFSAESTSRTMKLGVSTAPFQLGEISLIRVSDLLQYTFRSRHIYFHDSTCNSISRSHQSLKFVSACLAVDPNSRSEIQISFTGLKKFKSENGKKNVFLN